MTAFQMCRRSALAASLMLLGCKENHSIVSTAASSTIVDSAGTQIVENHSPLWTESTRWRIDSIPITSVGGNEDDTQQQFRYITAARRLSSGNVVIGVENELLLFDSHGKFLRTIAQKGSGPGEFTAIGDVWRLSGDSIFASQFVAEGGMKNVVINPDGSFSYEERPDAAKIRALGNWGECQGTVLPDRSRITCQNDPTIPFSATNRQSVLNSQGLTSPGPGFLRRLQRTFIIAPGLDTAYRIGITVGREQFGVAMGGDEVVFVSHPFYSRSMLSAGGNPLRIATITNPEYEVQLWTPLGKLERVIRRLGGRRAPTAQEAKDASDELLKTATARRQDPLLAAKIVAAVPVPDSLPAAVMIKVGDAGEIFVMREGLFPSQKFSLYDVFAPTGKWLGELRLPHRTRISEVGADYLLAIRYDDSDVPYAEVYRLHK